VIRPTDKQPLLLLDVDGVIHVLGPEPAEGTLNSELLVSVRTPALIQRLAERFELVWATSWEDEANDVVAPLLGIPPLPVVRFDGDVPLGVSYKLPPIQKYVGDRPFAWIDDDIGNDVVAWARDRTAPTLMLAIDPQSGLLEEDAAELEGFANRVQRRRS
jgi:hypothetical protein